VVAAVAVCVIPDDLSLIVDAGGNGAVIGPGLSAAKGKPDGGLDSQEPSRLTRFRRSGCSEPRWNFLEGGKFECRLVDTPEGSVSRRQTGS
jgi:hypothetical protein